MKLEHNQLVFSSCYAPTVPAYPVNVVGPTGEVLPMQDFGALISKIWCVSPIERKARLFRPEGFTFVGHMGPIAPWLGKFDCPTGYQWDFLLADYELGLLLQENGLRGNQTKCRCPCGCPHRPRKGNVWACRECRALCCQSCVGWGGVWGRCCLCRRVPPPNPPPGPPPDPPPRPPSPSLELEEVPNACFKTKSLCL